MSLLYPFLSLIQTDEPPLSDEMMLKGLDPNWARISIRDVKRFTGMVPTVRLGEGAAGIVFAINKTTVFKIQVTSMTRARIEFDMLLKCNQEKLAEAPKLVDDELKEFQFHDVGFSYFLMERLHYTLESIHSVSLSDMAGVACDCITNFQILFDSGICPADVRSANIMFRKSKVHGGRDALVFCDAGLWSPVRDVVSKLENERNENPNRQIAMDAITAVCFVVEDIGKNSHEKEATLLSHDLLRSVFSTESRDEPSTIMKRSRTVIGDFIKKHNLPINLLHKPYNWQSAAL